MAYSRYGKQMRKSTTPVLTSLAQSVCKARSSKLARVPRPPSNASEDSFPLGKFYTITQDA